MLTPRCSVRLPCLGTGRYKWLADHDDDINVVRVPHKQNRCVIFNSNLFHRTDTLRFKPGYTTRRINLTLLFGERQPLLSADDKAARKAERQRLLQRIQARQRQTSS